MRFRTMHYISFFMTGVIFQIMIQNISELCTNPTVGQWVWTIFLALLTAANITLDAQLVKRLKGE